MQDDIYLAETMLFSLVLHEQQANPFPSMPGRFYELDQGIQPVTSKRLFKLQGKLEQNAQIKYTEECLSILQASYSLHNPFQAMKAIHYKQVTDLSYYSVYHLISN